MDGRQVPIYGGGGRDPLSDGSGMQTEEPARFPLRISGSRACAGVS